MHATVDSDLPPVPQTGRSAPSAPPEGSQSLWQQILAAVSEVGNAIDPFASDAHPEVRTLGRTARRRTPRQADDYFALGDLCARLTLGDGQALGQAYAEKTITAYVRAGECSPADEALARRTILAFVFWSANVARMLGGYETLQTAAVVCERALRLNVVAPDSPPATQLTEQVEQLRLQAGQLMEQQERDPDEHASAQARSRKLCDEGQTQLRQQRTEEALLMFQRAIEADEQNATAWLWQALTLTDIARFAEALSSYDRAIQLDPANYGAWNSKGSLLMELGKVSEALECFEQALAMPLPPPMVKAAFLLNKGKALYLLGRFEEARDALVQSDQLDPTPESAAGVAACREMLTYPENQTSSN